jgi:hypothetical protein
VKASHTQNNGRYKPNSCWTCTNHGEGASVLKGDFWECVKLLPITTGESFSNFFPTNNARAITVFAKNVGEAPVTVSLQNSPNGLDFVDDPQKLELVAGKTGYLVPYIFSKYMRVVARSVETGTVRIWAQMQNYCYFQYPV